MATIEQILNRVQRRLYLAAGIGVQLNIEDTYLDIIRDVYEDLFIARWWPEYTYYTTYTLDGTTGHMTTSNTTEIKEFVDIHSVYYEAHDHPVPMLSMQRNPSEQFNYAVGPTQQSGQAFKMYPADTTGTVGVWYRTRLDDSVWELGQYTTEIPLDSELVVRTVCRDVAVDAGISDTIITKFAQKADQRFKQLKDITMGQPLSKSQNNTRTPQEWR
jgi:hypothetical protein